MTLNLYLLISFRSVFDFEWSFSLSLSLLSDSFFSIMQDGSSSSISQTLDWSSSDDRARFHFQSSIWFRESKESGRMHSVLHHLHGRFEAQTQSKRSASSSSEWGHQRLGQVWRKRERFGRCGRSREAFGMVSFEKRRQLIDPESWAIRMEW